MENNNHNKACSFEGDLIGYLYNELSQGDRASFENHLAGCHLCTEEFAGISEARFAVYEWQKLEFAPMKTPRIVIPYEIRQTAALFDGLRAVLSRGWAVGSLSFAALTLAAGLGFFVLSDGDDIVLSNLNTTQSSIGESSKVSEESGDVRSSSSLVQDKIIESEESIARPATVRITARQRQAPKRRIEKSNDRQRISPRPAPAVTAVVNNAPTLNQFEDVEDESLRLADLFADLDSSD